MKDVGKGQFVKKGDGEIWLLCRFYIANCWLGKNKNKQQPANSNQQLKRARTSW